jgi:hypothetical protein
MTKYRVKLTYKYVDFVDVEAESEEEAKDKAPEFSEDAQYESLYDADAIKVSD